MSDKVRAWVWELDLPPARKLVLLWLAGRATDNGVAFPGEREIRDKTGLGERMVRYHLQELAEGEVDQPDTAPGPLLLRIERRVGAGRNTSNVYVLRVPWTEPRALRRDLEELNHIPHAALSRVLDSMGVGAMGCPQFGACDGNAVPPVGATGCPEVGATGCREESSPVNRHRNTPPSPPAGAQQRGDLPDEPTTTIADLGSTESPQLTAARDVADAFYRGLGADAAAITPPIRKRDLAIARDLVAVGATPGEAESYAREMCAKSMRIAAVDLRSFERERLGWQARCAATNARTGAASTALDSHRPGKPSILRRLLRMQASSDMPSEDLQINPRSLPRANNCTRHCGPCCSVKPADGHDNRNQRQARSCRGAPAERRRYGCDPSSAQ